MLDVKHYIFYSKNILMPPEIITIRMYLGGMIICVSYTLPKLYTTESISKYRRTVLSFFALSPLF
jgi:hypothetical protein